MSNGDGSLRETVYDWPTQSTGSWRGWEPVKFGVRTERRKDRQLNHLFFKLINA